MLSGSLLVAMCLPMTLIWIAVRATSPGPGIYWSRRVGRDGRTFNMPKFRSMRVGTPQVATDELLRPTEYLTPIGTALRRSSLDELPQLWSVLVGEMSLVGPRPALFSQQRLIVAREQFGVHRIKPGITGLAQVSGRDELSDEAKVQLDAQYLNQMSLILDAEILARTVLNVMRSKGVRH